MICYHAWVQYLLSENLYVLVKTRKESNKNEIFDKYFILHATTHFQLDLYVTTISRLSFVARIEYFLT